MECSKIIQSTAVLLYPIIVPTNAGFNDIHSLLGYSHVVFYKVVFAYNLTDHKNPQNYGVVLRYS